MIEKMASGLRSVKRAVQSDLARFKAYVEMDDTKALEYTSGGGHADDEKGEEDEDQDDRESRARRDADEPKDSEDLAQAREERAERRKQRSAA
jgi:hypothetical protein